MKTREQKLLKYDDALLKRERSIRFTRVAATCFAALMFFSIITHAIHASKFAPTDIDPTSAFVVSTDDGNIDLKVPAILMFGFFFWAAFAHEYNLKSKHINSIKMYRSKLKEQNAMEVSQPSARGNGIPSPQP